jgi:hypothetical protein
MATAIACELAPIMTTNKANLFSSVFMYSPYYSFGLISGNANEE